MTIDEWSRRYEANQRVPHLPGSDHDDNVDDAVTRLREAAYELAESVTVSNVVRVLRHDRELAAQVLHKAEPICRSCGGDRHCLGCDDVRPLAEELGVGWRWFSPLGRWETVERVDEDNRYAPIRVWTVETGPGYSWRVDRHERVDAVAPVHRLHGTPEIRVVEWGYARDAPMYAVATLDTVHHTVHSDALAEAHYDRENGWRVTHRPDGSGEVVTVKCKSKAQARTVLKAAAGVHAKALGVKVTVQSTTRR